MNKKTFKIIEGIITGLLISIIVILSIFCFQRIFFKDKPAKILGIYIFEVSSYSMYSEGDKDSLNVGDLVFVIKDKEYEVGNVVSYLKEGETKPTTHKIVRIENGQYITKGINKEGNPSEDDPIEYNDILGSVRATWHGFANVKNFILSPYFIIGIVVVFVGSYFGLSFLEKKMLNKGDEKNNDEIKW